MTSLGKLIALKAHQKVMFEYLTPAKPAFGDFKEPYERAKVVFVGIPLDLTSSYRVGMHLAPSRIREASVNLETYQLSMGLDVFERVSVADLGDLAVVPADLNATGLRIEEVVQRLREDGKVPALLGGEHTITYFAVKAIGEVFLLQLDAHRDLREEYSGNKLCHATIARRVLDFLPAERLLQIGVRSCSKEEADFTREKGIGGYTPEQLLEDPKRVLADIRAKVGDARVYLSLDLDVLDPAFAPGVATPEPGGVSTLDALKLTRELGKLNLCGFDVVELTPPHDDGTTAFAAARIIYELLAAMG